MKKGKNTKIGAPTLRRRAEERLVTEKPEKGPRHEEDQTRLLHELQVHHIELEMQNEEVQRSRLETEESREKYLDLYDFAPVGYLTLDEQGMMSELNLAAAGFLGIERKHLVNKPFSHFIQPESQDVFYLHVREVLESPTKQTCELVLKKNDGTFLSCQMDSIGVEIKGQRVMRTVLMDITKRKEAEEALRKDHTELELRIQLRTAELSQTYEELQREMEERIKAEEKLLQSHKMEALGTFAGGIAHDFNNILASILGFTEMAIDDVPDRPLVEKNLKHVLKATMRARDLVKQILTFSSKTSHERTPQSLMPLVEETVQLLRASIPTSVEIKLAISAASDTVLAAPEEVQQILMNLAANASLAMQEMGGSLEVSLSDIDFEPDSPVLEPDVMPGEYVQLTVKDTGTGMSPNVMKRVFEPFFTTREVGKGTGMGLAIVYGIVKNLQGTITVESELGVGTTFRVLLPKVKAEQKEDQPHIAQIPRGNENILFVDDEEELIEWGQATLERLGYSVTALTDSTEALKSFSSDPSRFDLIITNQAMPGITGLHLSKELLRIRPEIPIILCTGYSETVSPKTAQETGIRQFLTKPLAKQELAQAVRRVLDTGSED